MPPPSSRRGTDGLQRVRGVMKCYRGTTTEQPERDRRPTGARAGCYSGRETLAGQPERDHAATGARADDTRGRPQSRTRKMEEGGFLM